MYKDYVFKLSNDSVFKEIFSKVPNALASLVSDIMNINYSILENNIQIERSELNKNGVMNKATTCDFIVKIKDSFKINVEINTSKSIGLEERNFLFVSRLYSNMIPKGIKYNELVDYKVAQINLNGFRNINDRILSRIMLTDLDTNIPTIQSIVLYNLDIAKCHDIYYNKEKAISLINKKLVRWGALLWTENISDIADIFGDDLMSEENKEKFIKEAEELNIRYKNFTQEQLEQHEEFKLAGEREAGIDLGYAHGIEHGLEQGLEQGMQHKETETVINMLNKDYEIKEISDITGLPEEEIMKIKESL